MPTTERFNSLYLFVPVINSLKIRTFHLLEIIEADCCGTLPKYCYSTIAMAKKENNENFNDS